MIEDWTMQVVERQDEDELVELVEDALLELSGTDCLDERIDRRPNYNGMDKERRGISLGR